MSDQPKPRKEDAAMPTTRFCGCDNPPHLHATEEHQPKPTGEWTPVFVSQLFEANFQGDTVKAIADAHNAALAAEKKHSAYCTKMANERLEQIVDANKQIAMDTECIERIRTHGMEAELELAAEREKVRDAEAEQKATEAGYDMIAQENTQLREQQQTLVDALERIATAQPCTVYQQDSVMRVDKFTAYLASGTVDVAKSVLAKVKEGK